MRAYLSPEEVSKILNISEIQVVQLIECEVFCYVADRGILGESVSEYLKDNCVSKKMNRRSFLAGSLSLVVPSVLGFLGGATSNFAGSLGASLVHHDLLENKETNSNSNFVSLAKSIFGSLEEASWSTNLDHLINTYGISNYQYSSTYLATKSLASSFFESKTNIVTTNEFPGPVFLDGDIVCIGSPVSDPIARRAFEMNGPRYEQIRKPDALLDLPYLYQPSDVKEEAYRFISGERRKVKNWTISEYGKKLPPPSYDNKGLIKSDYLLISRLPNFLSKQSFTLDKSILVVGGIHGTGTEAIQLLLRNKEALMIIAMAKKNNPYFQSLFFVSDILHSNIEGINKSIPMNIVHINTIPLNIDETKIKRILEG